MLKKNNAIVIFGSGGHAVSIANIAIALKLNIYGFIDPDKKNNELLGRKIISSIDKITDADKYVFALAVGDNYSRKEMLIKISASYQKLSFPPLIHPSAVIGSHVKIGAGTVVMPNVSIGPCCSIGTFCVLNTMASLDHDSQMYDFSTLAPGVICGGGVTIGESSFIGIGASLRHKVSIGSNTVVGGGSHLCSDITSNVIAYGSPARVIRSRKASDRYL
jgi:sugar O-acyltransferase (sialic acid O-acetyltransferase NeuD family)